MEAISRIVADIETGFNTNDPDLLVAHFIRNASAVNVMGIAHKLAWAVTADGDPIDADEAMIALYVFVRSQDDGGSHRDRTRWCGRPIEFPAMR